MDYNSVGQLMTKRLHSLDDGSTFMQSVSYLYNERGWLQSINSPNTVSATKVFGEQLLYNDGTTPQYNGNISGMAWQTMVPSGLGLTQIKQGYDYNYDNLNRLQVANYTTTGNIGKFNEQVSYDVMGNITALKRTNSTVAGQYLNNFTYDYTSLGVGNKLWGVADAGTAAQAGSYQYDVNGNVTIDTRNQITGISYNLLNLPQTVNRTPGNLTYIYDAQGTKLEKVSGGITRDYIGGIEYNNGAIEFIATEEGRAVPTGSTYGYEYYLKDHLGNTRAAVKQDGSIALVQDYYAFGLDMNPGNAFASTPQNQYKYNGKEKQAETGQYDYGARFYDPVIGRWTSVDRFAEKYSNLNSYHYCLNNPISNIDINGDIVIDKDNIVSNLKTSINQQITTVNGLIKNGLINAEFAAGYLGELNGTLSDITTLENSSVNYNIYNDASGNTAQGQGETRYNNLTGNVDIAFGIGVQPNDIYLQAHELVHGVQFENGDISLKADGTGAGSLVDVTDEVSANNRQNGLAAGLYDYGNRVLYTDQTLRNMVFPDGTKPYQSLKSGPININSIEGSYLRLKTTIQGQNGLPQSEIYKGSKKDYEAGKALKN